MVQTNMGLKPVIEEIIDVVPQTQKVKKKIAVNGQWEDRMFIRIPIGQRGIGPGELEKWCRDHYKEPRYLGPWFKVSGYIILDEKTYVHWKLCE
jgi:hypothetical protein